MDKVREFVKNEAENSFEIQPCDKYCDNRLPASIEIDSLKHFNYAIESGSFKIFITNGDKKIASKESDLKFTPETGEIEYTAVATDNVVQSPTDITFTL